MGQTTVELQIKAKQSKIGKGCTRIKSKGKAEEKKLLSFENEYNVDDVNNSSQSHRSAISLPNHDIEDFLQN
jgi:hypothetical protein